MVTVGDWMSSLITLSKVCAITLNETIDQT
jgi:hypothetical protein